MHPDVVLRGVRQVCTIRPAEPLRDWVRDALVVAALADDSPNIGAIVTL